jgi:hypothetical protein
MLAKTPKAAKAKTKPKSYIVEMPESLRKPYRDPHLCKSPIRTPMNKTPPKSKICATVTEITPNTSIN